MTSHKISEMPRASAIGGGEVVEIEFKSESGPLTLSFNPADLERMVPRMIEMIAAARKDRRAKDGRFVFRAVPVANALARSTEKGIVLTLHESNGILHPFVVTPELSRKMRKELESAEIQGTASKTAH